MKKKKQTKQGLNDLFTFEYWFSHTRVYHHYTLLIWRFKYEY